MESTGRVSRQSNFELLRIICMIAIVSLHYTVYGFTIPENQPVSTNLILLKFLSYSGRCAVDIFVMISGYFMVTSEFRAKKAIKLWLQVSIISAIFTAAVCLSGAAPGGREVLEGFFPILYNSYWFATTYFVLYLLSGFINTLVHALSRQRLLALVLLLFVIVSFLPTFFAARMASSNLLLFVMLYLTAAYIRLYSPKILESKYCLFFGIGLNLLFSSANMAMYALGESLPLFAKIGTNFDSMEKVPTVLCAVLIFAGFKNLSIGHSRTINVLGASTFGVYLIHHNPYMWDFWWKGVLHGPDYLHSPYMIVHAIASIILTYALCTLLDMGYRLIIEKPMWKVLDRHWDGWAAKLNAKKENITTH